MPSPSDSSFGTLTEAIDRSASLFPDRGVGILDRRGRSSARRTYPELRETAGEVAGRLARLGLGRDDPVLICLPTSWNWLDTWLGTVRLGGLPLAMAPGPMLGSYDDHADQVKTALSTVQGAHVVCTPRLKTALVESGTSATVVTPAELQREAPLRFDSGASTDPDRNAFLQLTSGTTGRQRAVAIRHRGAVHNAAAIGDAILEPLNLELDATPDATVVSWLPLYHDMGLVGSLLTGLAHGIEIQLLPPQAFLGRPRLWLELLGSDRRTVSTAPNFGYQFCVERAEVEELEGVDLSKFRAALVGAEMIHRETIEAFHRKFSPLGFALEAFRPCYGMAETTLAVTIDLEGKGPRTRRPPAGAERGLHEIVCLGSPIRDTRIRAVAADALEVPEGQVGEIEVFGPGVFGGYLNDPAATAECLVDGWLRTGDLGFIVGGELYVTGRAKEILIVRGENIMPHVLEKIAEGVTGGGGAYRAGAFSITAGPAGEQVVVAVESSTRDREILTSQADAIRRGIGEALALPVADVAFVPGGKIPKTTSGKVRREKLRREYLGGTLPRLDRDPDTHDPGA